MANSRHQQPGGEVFALCRALVLKYDPQVDSWNNTGGISKICLIQKTTSPRTVVYQFDGRLENSGQVTINVNLGYASEYIPIEGDPGCYKLIISDPQEIYVLRHGPESDGQEFAYVVQQVLRIIRDNLKPRTEVSPPPPRETLIAAPPSPSPSQPTREQLLTSSNLGKGLSSNSQYPGNRIPSYHNSNEQLNVPTTRTLSPNSPNLNEQRTALNQPTLSTSKKTPSPHTANLTEPRSTATRTYEANIESLCSELSFMISSGNVPSSLQIVTIMATEKLLLSIKLKNPKAINVETGDEAFNLKVVVEDRETSGGVFLMKVLPTTTIEKLREEVAERYGFPPKVQKWIIGKKMPKPSDTLSLCNVNKGGFTAYLYLVSGRSVGLTRHEFERYAKRSEEGQVSALGPQSPIGTVVSSVVLSTADNSPLSRTVSMPALNTAGQPAVEAFASHFEAVQPPTRILNRSNPLASSTLPINHERPEATNREHRIFGAQGISEIQTILSQDSFRNPPMEGDINQGHSMPVEDTEVVQQGWKCKQCTFINAPTRPGCEMCGGDRPEDYVVPENTMIREQERTRLEEERRQQLLFEQALEEQQNELARDREINFRQLLETAQQSLIQNNEEFDCPICFIGVLPGEGVVLRECLHSFCRDCLREHIRNCTDPEVQCPFQDDQFACHSLITGQEIKSLLSEQDFDKFLNRSLATAESRAANSFHCKTPNCPGWCIYEDNLNIFHCPVCDKQNCLTCKALHFPEMNCKEYQEDLKRRAQNDEAAKQTQQFLEQMITKGDAMKCPQCEIILLKKDGCDWMRCTMCRLEICWATRGPRWGPQGVGDTSAGCKCRVAGKKCHPKCHNCH